MLVRPLHMSIDNVTNAVQCSLSCWQYLIYMFDTSKWYQNIPSWESKFLSSLRNSWGKRLPTRFALTNSKFSHLEKPLNCYMCALIYQTTDISCMHHNISGIFNLGVLRWAIFSPQNLLKNHALLSNLLVSFPIVAAIVIAKLHQEISYFPSALFNDMVTSTAATIILLQITLSLLTSILL